MRILAKFLGKILARLDPDERYPIQGCMSTPLVRLSRCVLSVRLV